MVIYMTFFVTTVFAAVIIHQAGKCHFLIVAYAFRDGLLIAF